MIVFGTKGVTSVSEAGRFFCPGCGMTEQTYVRKVVRKFFTLYWIPLIPMGKLGEYLECQRCGNAYDEQVLAYDPAAHAAQLHAYFLDLLKGFLALATMEDGQFGAAKFVAAIQVYKHWSGVELSRAEFQVDVAQARQSGTNLLGFTAYHAAGLNYAAKEIIIQSVAIVLKVSDRDRATELALLAEMAATMGLTGAHFAGLMAQLGVTPNA
jgi:hypothetical protein